MSRTERDSDIRRRMSSGRSTMPMCEGVENEKGEIAAVERGMADLTRVNSGREWAGHPESPTGQYVVLMRTNEWTGAGEGQASIRSAQSVLVLLSGHRARASLSAFLLGEVLVPAIAHASLLSESIIAHHSARIDVISQNLPLVGSVFVGHGPRACRPRPSNTAASPPPLSSTTSTTAAQPWTTTNTTTHRSQR